LKIQKRTGTMAKKEIESISDDELIRIRQKLYEHDERYGLLFDLSENCALRRQEVINIRCSDISLKEIDGKDAMFIKLKKTKGNKERSVFVFETTAVELIKFIAKNNLTTKDYLFRSNAVPENHIDKTMWNKAFSRASFKATGKRYHPHQLRHNRSLKWYEKGMDIIAIQQRLGHSNISTTRLYINPDKIKEIEKWSREIE
jgi:integrase